MLGVKSFVFRVCLCMGVCAAISERDGECRASTCCMGVRVWGLGFGVWGLGFGVWGLWFGVWGLGFSVQRMMAANCMGDGQAVPAAASNETENRC